MFVRKICMFNVDEIDTRSSLIEQKIDKRSIINMKLSINDVIKMFDYHPTITFFLLIGPLYFHHKTIVHLPLRLLSFLGTKSMICFKIDIYNTIISTFYWFNRGWGTMILRRQYICKKCDSWRGVIFWWLQIFFWQYKIDTGTWVTPSSNLQLKKLRLCLISLIQIFFVAISISTT